MKPLIALPPFHQDPLAEVAEEEEEQDIEQQLFGSDDEGDDQDEEQAAPSKEDRKAKLQELAARKEAEKRDSESGKARIPPRALLPPVHCTVLQSLLCSSLPPDSISVNSGFYITTDQAAKGCS